MGDRIGAAVVWVIIAALMGFLGYYAVLGAFDYRIPEITVGFYMGMSAQYAIDVFKGRVE